MPQSAPTTATAPTSPSSGSSNSSPAGATTPLSADAIAAAADPSIVDVNTTIGFGEAAGAGTGMILSTSGLILTNNHVIDGATTISVRLVSTGRSYPATVVGTDSTDDVAVIKIDGVSGLKPIALGDSSTVAVGDPVVAIGNAGGVGGTPSVVTGTVTALDQAVTVSDEDGSNPENLSGLIQTDAPIQPGDSGGPLFNQSGQVIGINTAASVGGGRRFRAQAAEGLTIPINSALTIAHQIETGQTSANANVHLGLPGFLGVEIDSSQTTGAAGAPVVGVIPGSPAAGAGLGSGAVITSLDGQPIGSADELTAATADHHPGDKVSLGWTDAAGRQRHATVTLTSGPAS